MAITDVLNDVKSKLNELKRQYKFKKSRMAREDAVKLQVVLAECRGKLEICKKDFNRAINDQSRNIQKGIAQDADTCIQEQILWDAAIGYMLVRDAIFALETINSYDSVSHAYEMLDAAMQQISRKKPVFPKRMSIGSTAERNAYGYITSATALREKELLLEGFFESLKTTGNIESHLAAARSASSRSASRAHAVADTSTSDNLRNMLDSVPDADVTAEDFEENLSALKNIRPPMDSE